MPDSRQGIPIEINTNYSPRSRCVTQKREWFYRVSAENLVTLCSKCSLQMECIRVCPLFLYLFH